MPDPNSMFGFAGGQLQMQQAGDQHALVLQELAKGELDIKQTELMLNRQQALIDHLHQTSNPAQTQPGPMGPSPLSQQALALANQALDTGNAFMEQGFFKEGEEAMSRGVKLMENAQKIEEHDLNKQQAMWQTIGNLAPGVKDQQGWDHAKLLFMMQHPEMAQHPEVQKILQQPYSPELLDMLQRSSMTALQQVQSRKAEAETVRAEAGTRLDNARAATEPVRRAEMTERTKKLQREGEKGSKKEQELADLRDQTVDDIDDLLAQIDATPDIVGAKGFFTRGKERVETFFGAETSTPANRFQTSVDSMLLKLPKALTGSSKSAKDERARVNDIANVLQVGTTPQIAKQKLLQLKAILQQKEPGTRGDDSPSKGGKAISLDDYLKSQGF